MFACPARKQGMDRWGWRRDFLLVWVDMLSFMLSVNKQQQQQEKKIQKVKSDFRELH